MILSNLPAVMLADDESSYHQLFQRLLRGHDNAYRFLEAWDPETAIGMIAAEKPNVLFLDLHFPGRANDESLVKAVRDATSEFHPALMIFAVSGAYKTLDDRIKIYRAGADGFLSKPSPMISIRNAIEIGCTPILPARSLMPRKKSPTTITSGQPPKVLLIDDDPGVLENLVFTFDQEGCEPYTAISGELGLIVAHRLRFDAIVLDLGLDRRDMDGMDLLKILRASPRTHNIPLIVFSGRESEGQEQKCLDLGAAYLPKGAHDWSSLPRQVAHEIGRHARMDSQPCAVGSVTVDINLREAFVNGVKVHLTEMEFNLLAYLVTHSPDIVRWEELERAVWGWTNDKLAPREPRTIHATIGHLKEKLGESISSYFIVRKGIGIQFVLPT